MSSLPFGTHTLRIKAQSADGQPATNELVFTVLVVRPFYRSIWFFMLSAALTAAGIYIWYSIRLRQRQRFQEEEEIPVADSPTLLRSVSAQEKDWLDRLEQTVREHLADPQFHTEFVAEKMGLSRRQLQRRLQQVAGLSPRAYIQDIRLQEARRLLENRVYPSVKEVATAVGYPNTEYFSRQFRARFGKLPSQYLY